MVIDETNFWVFGYGSLMWRPGFEYEERHAAVLRGAHRKLCLFSYVHRGTPEAPGLVLGLDHGGSCRGIAFRIAHHNAKATFDYLQEREQMNYAYREAVRQVQLDDGRSVGALAFLVNRKHPQYAGVLDATEILRHVRQGMGKSGSNLDYVRNTALELKRLNIQDATLTWLVDRL